MSEIIQSQYSDEMQKSYLDYSMSVITDRAVPDVRDGLKPVQRRTIYAMHKLGLDANKPHRKSARIVGDTMGKYHPHGDTSIYDSLVVMQQEFKKNAPLVDGHGNFGSVEGDGAAAMRYTEARLHEFTMEVYLRDIEKSVVEYRPNFDETELEPVVLPARLPMALINGSEGIAVGMTTSIPSHNTGEIIDAMLAMLDRENIQIKKLLDIVKGPDFPLPCEIMNIEALEEIYTTGHGRLYVRGIMEEGMKNGKKALVISGLAPSTLGASVGKFIDEIVTLSDKKLTTDIHDISNESNQNGVRIVIELKRGAEIDKLKALIEAKTRFVDTVSVSMLVINNGKAQVMGLKDMISTHLKFLTEIQTKKYQYLLEQARDREEILEGLIRAVDIIDVIIEILRGSRSIEMAKDCLINGNIDNINFKTDKAKKLAEKLYFTKRQAGAILEMRLSKLIGLEIFALNDEYQDVMMNIKTYENLLSDNKAMKKLIKKELKELKAKFSHQRVTKLSSIKRKKYVEEKIEVKYSIEIDENDYIKAKKADGSGLESGSFDKLSIITSSGRQLLIKVEDIPLKKENQKGVPVETLCDYDRTIESILFTQAQEQIKATKILFVTRLGLGKLVVGEEFITNISKTIATKLKNKDSLVYVGIVDEKNQVLLKTAKGGYSRIDTNEIGIYSKTARGPKLISLDKEDFIAEALVVDSARVEEASFSSNIIKVSRVKLQKVGARPIKIRL